jgi:membrane protease YdiL (CAAX protease family)
VSSPTGSYSEVLVATAKRKRAIKRTLLVFFGIIAAVLPECGIYLFSSAYIAFALYQVFCLSAWGILKNHILPMQSDSQPRSRWPIAISIGVSICACAWIIAPHMGWILNAPHIRSVLWNLGINRSPISYAVLLVCFTLINPIVEELFWRRCLYRGFRETGLSANRSAVVSGVLFGVWHWLVMRLLFAPAYALLITIGVVVFGWILSGLYERFKSLPLIITIHALAADIPAAILILFCVRHIH